MYTKFESTWNWNLCIVVLFFHLFLLCTSIQDLKERIRQRTNLPLGPSIDTHGETFLSQEVVVNLLQETKQAFERCHRVRIVHLFNLYIAVYFKFCLYKHSALWLRTPVYHNKKVGFLFREQLFLNCLEVYFNIILNKDTKFSSVRY